MTADEFHFEGEMQRLMLAMRVIEEVNLDLIIEAVERADAIGPLIDPTAYRDMLYRDGNMHDVEAVARALLEPVRLYRERVKVHLDG